MIVLGVVCSLPVLASDIYVLPTGLDAATGTKEAPLKTLEAALKLARKSEGVVTIWLGGGTYDVKKTVSLTKEDSGTEKAPLLIRAVEGARPVFSGGHSIDLDNVKLVSNSDILSMLNPTARGKIYSVQITEPQMQSLLTKDSAKLSMNGRMMNLARYPNVGYGHIGKILDKGAVYAYGRSQGDPLKYRMDKPIGGEFTILDKEISLWEEELKRGKQATVTGYLSYDWYRETHRIALIDDRRIKLLEYSRYGILNTEKIPRRIVVRNLLCELDEPGEFYYDVVLNQLFFWPFGDTLEDCKLSLWTGVPFAEIKGASNIKFENLIIEGISQGKAVVYIDGSENVRLAGCTIRNCSISAIVIEGGKNCGILSCDIYDVPHHVTLNGGDVKKLIPAGHYAENCHFTQVQASDYYGRIQLRGVGNIFRNNLVHNFIGQVMTVGDNDHLIEYNEFFNIGIEEGDGGAIYSGAQMTSWGNVYRHNFLHHLMCVPQAHPRGGIYPDDGDMGDTITENIFYKAAHRAVLINGGAGHTVTKNIFLNGHIGIYNRELGCEKTYLDQAKYDSGELKRGDKTDYIWKTEQAIGKEGWNKEPWISKYPLFAKIMNQEKMRFWPIECDFSENYFYGNFRDIEYRVGSGDAGIKDIRDVEHIRSEKNKPILMRVFKNPSVLDFQYADKNMAKQLPDIQFDKIGLYRDAYRKNPPDKNNYRKAVRDKFAHRKSYDEKAKYDPKTINNFVYFNTGKLLIQNPDTPYR